MNRMDKKPVIVGVSTWVLLLLSVWWVAHDGANAFSVDNTGWLTKFEDVVVAPVAPSETANLVDAGIIETDGFKEMVLCIGGDMKSRPTQAGEIGVVLVPDLYPFDLAFENHGRAIFSIENTATVVLDDADSLFESDQVRAAIAFPRYRVFLYNTTDAPAGVWVYAYRTR